MPIRLRRSALYLPASNPRAIAKARNLACDVVILDLEDAVAPDAKAVARAQAAAAVAEGGFGRRELVVRVNGLTTEWGADDLAALREVRPDAILVPKVGSPAELQAWRAALARDDVPLWGMIETAGAVLALPAIVGAGLLAGVIAGTNDLAKELRMRPGVDRAPLQGMLAMLVAGARAHDLIVLDGVYNDIGDAEGFARQCAQGVDFGFDGKTLIHPAQIAACNAAFSPAPADIAAAAAIDRAFALPENAGRGAIRLEGRMVERLHLVQAQRTLALARAVGEAEQ